MAWGHCLGAFGDRAHGQGSMGLGTFACPVLHVVVGHGQGKGVPEHTPS